MPRHPLSQRIADVLDLQPNSQAIEYDGRWISWAQVSAEAQRIAALTAERGAEVGMLLRNRPGHVAAFLGVLLGGGTVVVINPSRGDERTRSLVEFTAPSTLTSLGIAGQALRPYLGDDEVPERLIVGCDGKSRVVLPSSA